MSNIPLPSITCDSLWKKIPFYTKLTFLSAVLLGLLAHAFVFTNFLPNHDVFYSMFNNLRTDGGTWSGRWFLRFPKIISSVFGMPWVNGILGILYLAVTACFIGSLLRVKTPIYCVLLAALIVVFPVVAATHFYIHTSDAIFFAAMLSSLAVHFTVRYRFGFCAGIPLLVFSLGIYQAYFALAAGLFVAVLLLDALRGEKAKCTLLRGVRYVITLGAGMAIYLVTVRLTAGNNLTTYQGINTMGQIPLSDLPTLIVEAYMYVIRYFRWNWYGDHFSSMRYLFALLAMLSGGLFCGLVIQKRMYRNLGNLLLLGLLLLLFPLAFNVVVIMNGVHHPPHLVMSYGLVLAPVFCLALLELAGAETEKSKKIWHGYAVPIISWSVALSLAVCTFGYWVRTNQAYFKQHLVYEQGYAFSNTLLTRIQSLEDYTGEEEIWLIGNASTDFSVHHSAPALEVLLPMTGIIHSIPQTYSYGYFLRYFLGNVQEIRRPHYGDLREMGLVEIVEGMPFYPADGSILRVHNRIVVRFSTNVYDPAH